MVAFMALEWLALGDGLKCPRGEGVSNDIQGFAAGTFAMTNCPSAVKANARSPLGDNPTESTWVEPPAKRSRPISFPDATSQTRAVLSPAPEISRSPAAENARLTTQFSWPFSNFRNLPVFASHKITS